MDNIEDFILNNFKKKKSFIPISHLSHLRLLGSVCSLFHPHVASGTEQDPARHSSFSDLEVVRRSVLLREEVLGIRAGLQPDGIRSHNVPPKTRKKPAKSWILITKQYSDEKK